MIQKTFMLSHHEIMWVETWPNLMLKMRDMPYWHYNSERKETKDENTVYDDVEILKSRFGKFKK